MSRDRRGLPLRRSLLVRLLAVSAVVSICSIAAVAWLAVRTTTRAIQQEQSQALTDDARIYDTLLGYAAVHPDWSDVEPTVRDLARQTGHRIALTGPDQEPLADSAEHRVPLPGKASATVDPLSVDKNAADDRIDPRAVGPFLLPASERARLTAIAQRLVDCLRSPPSAPAPAAVGQQRAIVRDASVVKEPSGRPRVETSGKDLAGDTACATSQSALAEPTGTERKALKQLDDLTNACLHRRGIPAVLAGLDSTWTWLDPASARTGLQRGAAISACIAGARREQLGPYVAPPATLYVTTPGTATAPGLDLSPVNRARIAGVSALVLLVTFGVTVLAGIRLVRPLEALTGAAHRMRDGDGAVQVAVTGRDEIARLATAFNDMSERRRQVEALRQAMVGDIAHEMRTPVTNIRGWLEAAEEGVVPLDRELMSSLLEEALLLQHVIEDLQDLSAADAGELRLHPERVDLRDLLGQVAGMHRAAADRGGVTLAVDAAPDLELVADPIRLRQAVGNLVANALRHTPPGGRVTLSGRVRRENNDAAAAAGVLIEVVDSGSGIAADDLPWVFERFWRAEKSRNRSSGGSGLGLSIVRKLAEAHGGAATVASVAGRGSTFGLWFPRPGHSGGGKGSQLPDKRR